MFVAYLLIAFGACFVFGFIAMTLIGSALYLSRVLAKALWPAREPVVGKVSGQNA